MRVLICGGRSFKDRGRFNAIMDMIHGMRLRLYPPTQIIHGAARGADTLAQEWAETWGYETRPFRAAWTDLSHPDALIREWRNGEKYDALAGHRRNQEMIDEGKPDLVVAFPGGRGTADMIVRAEKAGIEVILVPVAIC